MKKHRWELLAVAALLAVSAALGLWFYRPRGGDAVAVVTVDSVEYRRVDLAREKDGFFTVEGRPVSFEIKDHAIRFVNVTCPDHICEKAGWCERPGDRAVCMPNRVTLVCYARDELG